MENNAIYECRICRDEGNDLNDFISPCSCKGSVEHVHKECLNQWLSVNRNTEKYLKCQECNAEYKRSEPAGQKLAIDQRTGLYSLTLISGISIITLLLLLCVNYSLILCNLILFFIYLICICSVASQSSGYGFIFLILLFCIFFSLNQKYKTCIVDFLIIIFYGNILFCIVGDWECIKKTIKANYLDSNTMAMFDYFTQTYVNGVI